MLVLTRRPGESVKIGDSITVTVLAVRGNQLRLGFTAPQDVAVHRQEVYQRIQAEKIANSSQLRSIDSPLRLPTHRRVEVHRRVRLSQQTRIELLKW